MNFIFIVQGEGRGHMTQAISLYQILKKANHTVQYVFLGRSSRRDIPQFFLDKMEDTPVEGIASPNFVTDKNNKSVKVLPSIIYNLKKFKLFKESLKKIDDVIQKNQPDVIVNFYDFIGGLYNRRYKHTARFVCVAHQYLMKHPDFPFAPGRVDRFFVQKANDITSMRADELIALSFREYSAFSKLTIVPPLLRSEVFQLQPQKEDFILVYMVNDGYGEEVKSFHEKNPGVKLYCFWDRKRAPKEDKIDDTLTFHQIDDKKFLEKMASCQGYASTAGFESICEAMYLSKPVMMVPVAKQYEQECNALDAELSGAGISSETFNISKLVDYIPKHPDNPSEFQDWVQKTEGLILKALTNSQSEVSK